MTDQFQRAISAAAEEHQRKWCDRLGNMSPEETHYCKEDFTAGAQWCKDFLSQPASAEHGPRVWIFIYKDEQGNEFIEADRHKFGKKEEDQYVPLTKLLAEKAKRVWAEEKLQEEITQVEIRMSDRHQRQMNAEREKAAKLRVALEEIVNANQCRNRCESSLEMKTIAREALAETEAAPIEAEKEEA
jgi:hypothetical protein